MLHASDPMGTNAADYNAFGYDPEGRLAAVAAYFYGPAWKPVNQDNTIPLPSLAIAPPRYGPPALWQFPSLPAGFTHRLPPCYIGQPCAFLPGPDTFNTTNFAPLLLTLRDRPIPIRSLEAQYGRRILEGFPVGEVKDKVFWTPVYYVIESQRREFCVMSDMAWETFREMICTRLDVDATRALLAYRLYVDGYSEANGLTRLVDEDDWLKAMHDVGAEFEYGNDVEVEVLEVNCTRPKGNAKNVLHEQNNDLDTWGRRWLSSRAPGVETYAFVYPSLLLDLPEGYAGLEKGEIELIGMAGVENADDFTFLSPMNLCLSTGIAPKKIVALYYWATTMIAKVHREQEVLVAELQALRDDVLN